MSEEIKLPQKDELVVGDVLFEHRVAEKLERDALAESSLVAGRECELGLLAPGGGNVGRFDFAHGAEADLDVS